MFLFVPKCLEVYTEAKSLSYATFQRREKTIMSDTSDFTQQAENFRQRYNAVKDEVGKVIVGHDEIVHGVLTCMMLSLIHISEPTRPY